MSDSRLEKTQLMFPQVRNLHNKVFGGYLMRLAYEVSIPHLSGFSFWRLFIGRTFLHNVVMGAADAPFSIPVLPGHENPRTSDGEDTYVFLQLGFASASLFCRGPIRFFSLDGISFAKPVPIG